jgi:hypothetical protein
MTVVVGLVREGAWNVSLFFHVLGAMAMMGGLALAVAALSNGVGSLRLGYRALLLVALPGWLVMRVAAQWVLEESPFDEESGWIGIGFMTSEAGLLLLIAATVCARQALKRDPDRAGGLSRWALGLSAFLLVVYVVTLWAMTTKPD